MKDYVISNTNQQVDALFQHGCYTWWCLFVVSGQIKYGPVIEVVEIFQADTLFLRTIHLHNGKETTVFLWHSTSVGHLGNSLPEIQDPVQMPDNLNTSYNNMIKSLTKAQYRIKLNLLLLWGVIDYLYDIHRPHN